MRADIFLETKRGKADTILIRRRYRIDLDYNAYADYRFERLH